MAYIIRKAYIRSTRAHLTALPVRQVRFGCAMEDVSQERLRALWLRVWGPLELGDSGIPPGVFGTVSSYNKAGKTVKLKDQPKVRWKYPDGRVSRPQYRTRNLPPPGLRLTVLATSGDQLVIATDVFDIEATSDNDLIHAINLILEIFGHCQVLDREGEAIGSKVRQLDWEPLPANDYPWTAIRELLSARMQNYCESDHLEILERLEYIFGFKPDFTALGPGGYSRYVVFGFETLGIFVLESLELNNATYLLGSSWERQSRLSKSQLLATNGVRSRLIHDQAWRGKIWQLLTPAATRNGDQ